MPNLSVERRARFNRIADEIAVQEGLAAVTLEAVYARTRGNRKYAEALYREWRSRTAGFAALMPAALEILSVKLGREAWVLAGIALGRLPDEPRPTGPAPTSGSTKAGKAPPPGDPPDAPAGGSGVAARAIRSISDAPRPRDVRRRAEKEAQASAVENAPPNADGPPKNWRTLKPAAFADLVMEILSEVGRPLTTGQIHERLEGTTEGFDFETAHRMLVKRLEGSRAIYRWRPKTWWIQGRKPRRPSKGPPTDLAKRRRDSPKHIARALDILKERREMSLAELWDELKAPPGYRFDRMDHALREHAKSEPRLSIVNGIAKWSRSPSREI